MAGNNRETITYRTSSRAERTTGALIGGVVGGAVALGAYWLLNGHTLDANTTIPFLTPWAQEIGIPTAVGAVGGATLLQTANAFISDPYETITISRPSPLGSGTSRLNLKSRYVSEDTFPSYNIQRLRSDVIGSTEAVVLADLVWGQDSLKFAIPLVSLITIGRYFGRKSEEYKTNN